MVVMLLALAMQIPALQPDPDRDRHLHKIITDYFSARTTDEQLEEQLQRYAREFHAKPYAFGDLSIPWQEYWKTNAEGRLLRFMTTVAHITSPALKAYFDGVMTLNDAASRIAPFFLMFGGFGLDPPPDAAKDWHAKSEALMNRIGAFMAR